MSITVTSKIYQLCMLMVCVAWSVSSGHGYHAEYENSDVLPALYAGEKYPADADMLREDLAKLLKAVPLTEPGFEPRIILMPHGSMGETGAAMAPALQLLERQNPDRLVLLSSTHKEQRSAVSVFTGKRIETVVGAMNVDQAAGGQLIKSAAGIIGFNHPHMHDFSLNSVLPLVRLVLPDIPVVLVLAEGDHPDRARELSDGLATIMTPRSILLCTVELAETSGDKEAACGLDQTLIQYLQTAAGTAGFEECVYKPLTEYAGLHVTTCAPGTLRTLCLLKEKLNYQNSLVLDYRQVTTRHHHRPSVTGAASIIFGN